jgi:hypothetical protein
MISSRKAMNIRNGAISLLVSAISLVLIPSLKAQANPAACNLVIREVRSQIQQRHRVSVLDVNQYSLEILGYANPLYDSIRLRNAGYSLTISDSPAALSFLKSPQIMRSYAQKIADACPSAAVVSFDLERSDRLAPPFGLDPEGQMQPFECVSPDLASDPMPWGYSICP